MRRSDEVWIMTALLRACILVLVFTGFSSCQNNNSANDESTWENCICDNGPCSCVLYYLCGLDGVILDSGDTLLDPRFGSNEPVERCSGIQICCKDPRRPNGTTTESSRPGPGPKPPPQKPNRKSCGVRDTSFGLDQNWARDDIDNGATVFAEFPWMLALLRRDRQLNVFQCGASLIHEKVALTAAHCVDKLSTVNLMVRAGEWNTTSRDEPVAHQDRGVSKIILHPEYRESSLFNDIALLELDSPFQEAINVGVVCLPEQGTLFDGQRCVASGWGRDSFGMEGQIQTTLRKVDLPVVEHSACQASLRTTRLGIFYRLDQSFICAGGEADKDTCKGDGGGPLMCQSKRDPQRYIQAGIVSWGIGCKERLIPAVYTNVASLRNWIDSELSSLGLENMAVHP